ncbi:MAG: hypothetical protein FD180_3212 [Planctomycetota bacterium]|nr:MAG: hypothetical protein FD180_3212 [Planctomycetota bacterium]
MRRLSILLTTLVLLSSGCDLRPGRRPKPSKATPPTTPSRPTQEAAETAAWEEVEARSEALVAGEQFGAALRLLMAESLVHPARAERNAALQEAILAAARTRSRALDRIALEAIRRGDEEAAMAAWSEILLFDVPEISDSTRSAMQEGQLALFRMRRTSSLPKLGVPLFELQKLVLARNYEQAMDLVERLTKEQPELHVEIEWMRVAVMDAPRVLECVEKGLIAMKGEVVEVSGGTAEVAGASAAGASFRRPNGDVLDHGLPQLPSALLQKAGLRGGASADYIGQYFLLIGRVTDARAAFQERKALNVVADWVERALAGGGK